MHVPSELARRNHWIVWKTIERRGTKTKLPFSALSRNLASTSDPTTWATLAQAQTALATGQYAGLGFVFAKDDCLFGVDLDECCNGLYGITDWAEDVVYSFRTYGEVSPSRRGLKLFCIGEHQAKGCVKPMGEAKEGRKRPAIEVYGWGRYFAFTGDLFVDAMREVEDCRDALARLLATIKPEKCDPAPRASSPPAPNSQRSLIERGRLYLRKVPPATSGQGGHNRTFRAACCLVREIGLSQADAVALLMEWNEKCLPPWSEPELWHKVSDAAKAK